MLSSTQPRAATTHPFPRKILFRLDLPNFLLPLLVRHVVELLVERPPYVLDVFRCPVLVQVGTEVEEVFVLELAEAHQDGGFGAVHDRDLALLVRGKDDKRFGVAIRVFGFRSVDIDGRASSVSILSVLLTHDGER